MTPITKYVLVIVITIICSLNIISIFGEVSEDGKLFADALQLMKEKDFQSSLIKIRQFLSTNPDNFEAKTNECAILLELKQVSEAEACLEINLTKKPDDLTNLLNLGMLYALQENYEAAKIQFSLVHQRNPNDETAYANLLAVRLLIGDNADQIVQEHKELLEKNEFNVQVLVNLGKILNDKREFEKAKYFLDRAYEIDNKHVNVLEQLGVWYALNGDFQNADRYFQDALKESPENISVLNNLGLLYRDRADRFNDISMYYKSIGYYESVLLLDSDNVYANIGLDYSAQKVQEIYHDFYFRIYLYAIGVFVIGIFITWTYTRNAKKLEKSLETKTDDKEREKILKKVLKIKVIRVFLIGLLSIAASILILNQTLQIPLNDDLDMANWTSTVIEIGIGIMIAVVILVYELSKQEQFSKEQNQIKELINSTKNMTLENKQLMDKVTKSIDLQKSILMKQDKQDLEKYEQENKFYKVELLANLISMLLCIKQALHQQLRYQSGHINEKEFGESMKNIYADYGYWSDRITNINSNTYAPPEIRNSVRMMIHQAVKSINYSSFALKYDFLEKVIFSYVDFIIDSEYVKTDNDSMIQKFRTNIIEDKQTILNLRKEYQEKHGDSN